MTEINFYLAKLSSLYSPTPPVCSAMYHKVYTKGSFESKKSGFRSGGEGLSNKKIKIKIKM